jgi:putative membrane protein
MTKHFLVLVAVAGTTPAFAQVMPPSEYVKTAGAGDFYERQSSALVLETTSDPAVRSFARMMIAHHSKSTAEVKAAALRSRVRVTPAMLTLAQEEMIAQLRAERGSARDAAYIAQQRAAHGQALAVQEAYATDGTAFALKAAAAKIVLVVKSHIAMLKTM